MNMYDKILEHYKTKELKDKMKIANSIRVLLRAIRQDTSETIFRLLKSLTEKKSILANIK
ncbi:MAG: hypothetical protein LBE18_11490 [Planctomycetaceae bacterium]|nr:hypothetical protein [Planctomycetaceae bacterium]